MIYRRREIDLKNDIEDVVMSKAKKALFWLLKAVFKSIIDDLLKMLKDKGWVDLEDTDEFI